MKLSLCLVLLLAINLANNSHVKASEIQIPGWEAIDWLAHTLVPKLVGSPPNNQNGSAEEFKDYLLNAPDEHQYNMMSLEELITAAGYEQENYKTVADDGYITSMTRLINPLADRRKLKWPPVLLMHGGTIDPTAYVMASLSKHHPEIYPRPKYGQPMTSWNRSLAFMLANNGYDVWLAETRGSSERNLDHIATDTIRAVFKNEFKHENMTSGEKIRKFLTSFNYWSFSQDDIIAHEIKSYIDKICQVTVSEMSPKFDESLCKVYHFSFSLSTPLALGFYSIRHDYARERIHRAIIMAPTFYRSDDSPLLKFILQVLCPMVPQSFMSMLFYDLALMEIRRVILIPAEWKKLRYTAVKSVISLLMGPSAKYRTFLELSVLHHLMRIVGFKQAQQMCQQMKYDRLQKYDYGPEKNLKIYNSSVPPEYPIDAMLIKPPLLISAENDIISSPRAVRKLIEKMNPKPYKHIIAPQFNHLDLVAGVENDKYVNLPILQFMDKFAEKPPAPRKDIGGYVSSNKKDKDAKKFYNK